MYILGPLVLQGPILQNPFEAGGPCFGPHSCQLHMDDRKPTTVAVGSALSNGAIVQLDLLCAWSTSKGFTKFAFFTKQILDLDQTKYTPSLCLLWPVLLAGTADFWMQLLGGPCPKPTSIWCNSRMVLGLDLGRLPREVRESKTLETSRGSLDMVLFLILSRPHDFRWWSSGIMLLSFGLL